MKQQDQDRRSFLKIAGTSLGIGVLYSAYPAALAKGEAGDMFASLGRASGEKVAPFSSSNSAMLTSALTGRPTPLVPAPSSVPWRRLTGCRSARI